MGHVDFDTNPTEFRQNKVKGAERDENLKEKSKKRKAPGNDIISTHT